MSDDDRKPTLVQVPVARDLIDGIGQMLGGLTKPLAEADIQRAVQATEQEREVTKQVEIEAKTTRLAVKIGGAIIFGVLVLCGIGLFLGNSSLAEKVLVGILGFLGGYGLGKRIGDKK